MRLLKAAEGADLRRRWRDPSSQEHSGQLDVRHESGRASGGAGGQAHVWPALPTALQSL
jgi:hypothetical protein